MTFGYVYGEDRLARMVEDPTEYRGHRWAFRKVDAWGAGVNCKRCGRHFTDDDFFRADGVPECQGKP